MKNLYINNLIYLTMINYKINRIESNTNDFRFLCGKSVINGFMGFGIMCRSVKENNIRNGLVKNR